MHNSIGRIETGARWVDPPEEHAADYNEILRVMGDDDGVTELPQEIYEGPAAPHQQHAVSSVDDGHTGSERETDPPVMQRADLGLKAACAQFATRCIDAFV